MKPDSHKAKESRKYQNKKKKEGDSTAAEIAEARKRASRARDKGQGMAAIQRRNGELVESEQEREERKELQAKFSRRKLESNQFRYKEESEQELLERDAEMGIDRETTDLVFMLENNDEGSSTFFKFKDEQLFAQDAITQDSSKNMLQLDFKLFENGLGLYEPELLLGLNDSFNKELVYNALNEQPIVVDKPIVPSFSKNAKGYVLFKSQTTKPNKISESEGIYIRNDGSNHRVIPPAKPAPEPVADDLDELLALEPTVKKTPLPKPASTNTPLPKPVSVKTPLPKLGSTKTPLPKPGFIKKPEVKQKVDLDDEAWLDDILG